MVANSGAQTLSLFRTKLEFVIQREHISQLLLGTFLFECGVIFSFSPQADKSRYEMENYTIRKNFNFVKF